MHYAILVTLIDSLKHIQNILPCFKLILDPSTYQLVKQRSLAIAVLHDVKSLVALVELM